MTTTNDFPNNDPAVYHDLIDYFARDTTPPPPIVHPDQDVNQRVNGREHSLRDAAVLIAVTRPDSGNESEIVLTVRSKNLKSHAGQISLPGGTREDHDRDAVATALRESEEEIGLQPGSVEVIGQLGDMALPSGFKITPIVGLIETGLSFTPCPIEVAGIFQAPLELVLNPDAYTSSTVVFDDKPRKILELQFEGYRIWGATAAILHHLAREVRNTRNRQHYRTNQV